MSEKTKKRRRAPAIDPEERENQMIAMAVDLAEQKLLDGTATSPIITHYLKLGSMRERLEREKLQQENSLLRAKTKSIESIEKDKELYLKVLDALKVYNGVEDDEYEDLQ